MSSEIFTIEARSREIDNPAGYASRTLSDQKVRDAYPTGLNKKSIMAHLIIKLTSLFIYLSSLYLLITVTLLSTPAYGENEGIKSSCDKASIIAMVSDVKTYQKKLNDTATSSLVDVSNVIHKYIAGDCELSNFMIDLINVGFRIADPWRLDPTTFGFNASIMLDRNILAFSSVTFRLTVHHALGRIKSITGNIVYHNL